MLFFQGFLCRSRGNGRGKSGLQGMERGDQRGRQRGNERGEQREGIGKSRGESRGKSGKAEGKHLGESRGEGREVVGWNLARLGQRKRQVKHRLSISLFPISLFLLGLYLPLCLVHSLLPLLDSKKFQSPKS
jgi:hypothetical protein